MHSAEKRIYYYLSFVFLLAACAGGQKKPDSGPDAMLKRSATAGDAAGIERALVAGANPGIRDERGRIPLHLAVMSGNIEAVKQLLLPKATVAAKKTRREGVAILPYQNNTNSKNYAWIGASLPDAIQGSMAETFEFKRLDSQQKGQAAVVIAGSYVLEPDGKKVRIATRVTTPADGQILVESEVLAPLDTNIFEALHQVAQEIVNRLKEYTSAEFAIRLKNSEQILISEVNARDRGDLTPLATAAAQGSQPMVELLIKAGADYQADLIDAINYGNDGAGALIAAAAPDVNYRIAGGKTPLIQASFKGRLPIVNALLVRKANGNLQDIYGFTALIYAAQEGHDEVVRELMRAQFNVNIRTWDEFSALEAARRKGRKHIVEMLGKAGAK